MVKKCTLIMLIFAALAGITVFFACGRQKIHCETGIKNLEHYYILEFEKMNREDSCTIPVCKDDEFAVNVRIDTGHVDFIIAMDGNTPIYKGNDIEDGEFNVIVPADGAYRITVNAKHASGYVEVYAKKGVATNYDN